MAIYYKFIPSILKLYKEKLMWDLYKEYNYISIMQIPYISKIVLSACCGKFFLEKKKMQEFYTDMFLITLQKPINIKSKFSISNFKIKKNDILGYKVTLRKNLMYFFFDKLINIVLPRIVNFNGLPISSIDNQGNYNMGINDCSIFLEVEQSNFNFVKGLHININIISHTKNESFSLLKNFNFPFKY